MAFIIASDLCTLNEEMKQMQSWKNKLQFKCRKRRKFYGIYSSCIIMKGEVKLTKSKRPISSSPLESLFLSL